MTLAVAVVDRIIGVAVIVFSLFLYRYSGDFPLQAEIYPQFVLKVMIALSALLIASSFLKKEEREKEGGDGETRFSEGVRPLLTFGVVALYVYLLRPLGFFASSALFLGALLCYLGTRRLSTFLYTILGVLGFVYVTFVVQLKVPLPRGILF